MNDPKVLELYSPPNKRKKPVSLKVPPSIQKQPWTGSQPQKTLAVLGIDLLSQNSKTVCLRIPGGKNGSIDNLLIPTGKKTKVDFLINFSKKVNHLQVYPLIISQYMKNDILTGKYLVDITAIGEKENWFYVSPPAIMTL
ncbi:MAG: hypothetical protein GX267_07785 [Fibrobacter sp.]|jgi:hypothetical protein|nr:hypothetical protein [Fibrobacter sp.]